MNLFIVLYLAGEIAAVGGPVDGSAEECRQAVAQAVTQTDFSIVTSYGYTVDDVRADCEWHNDKPAISDEAAPPTLPPPEFLLIGGADAE